MSTDPRPMPKPVPAPLTPSLASIESTATEIPLPMPPVVSHRTNRGSMPENSLAGLRAAIAEGAAGVEVDVRATSDGVLVLMHDELLERTTGDKRPLALVSSRELGSILLQDPFTSEKAEPVPTLQQAIEEAAGKTCLVIDVKQPGLDISLRSLLEECHAGPCWVWTADPGTARSLRSTLPRWVLVSRICTPAATSRAGIRCLLEEASRYELDGILLESDCVEHRWAVEAAERGLQLHSGVTNETSRIAELARIGVDSVSTDFPSIALADAAGARAIIEDHSVELARTTLGAHLQHAADGRSDEDGELNPTGLLAARRWATIPIPPAETAL